MLRPNMATVVSEKRLYQKYDGHIILDTAGSPTK